MATSFVHHRRVEFRDTDAAGIAHFSVFFVWMEQAEHAALRELGIGVMHQEGSATISWPRVSATCDYRNPVSFEAELEIVVTIARIGKKSVKYEFDFRSGDQQIAKGELTTVCCQLEASGSWRAISIPPTILQALQPLTG